VCLILFAVNPDSRYRLIVAANRDEFYARPTIQANFWSDEPDILAGRDENMGGTWLGVNRNGRFSAVTNFREEPPDPMPPNSRGDLPLGFLKQHSAPLDYVQDVSAKGSKYRGFNLVVADSQSACYYGNRAGEPKVLPDGCYGLSNQLLDCNWPKVIEGRSRLQALISSGTTDLVESLFDMLTTGGDEREFSNPFIRSDTYGTRAATVVVSTTDGELYFEERNFGEHGEPLARRDYRFNCNAGS